MIVSAGCRPGFELIGLLWIQILTVPVASLVHSIDQFRPDLFFFFSGISARNLLITFLSFKPQTLNTR